MTMNAETNKYQVLKQPISSTLLMDFDKFSTMKTGLSKNTFVAAHTRFSTVGGNTWQNTHPFDMDRYVGMQNGTIHNLHSKLVPGKTSPYAVDSASVFWSFEQQGVEATFEHYRGDGVFMYFDKLHKTFNIVKNDARNLHRAKVRGYDCYIFATDKYAIELAASRSLLAIEEVEEVEDDVLHTYTKDSYFTTPLVVQQEVLMGNAYGNYGNYGNNYGNYNRGTTYGNGKPTTKPASGKVSKLPTKSSARPVAALPDKSSTKPSTIQQRTKSNLKTQTKDPEDDIDALLSEEYLGDCDCCSNPIFSHNLAFTDTGTFVGSNILCCSSCVAETQQQTGKHLYKLAGAH